MAEMRIGRGWSDDELAQRLGALERLERSFPQVHEAEMSDAAGYRREAMSAVIAREPPGPPQPGGAFDVLREALCRYAFSDPDIVAGHFDAAVPLRERRMLLELKVLGMRYLQGVVVDAVREEADESGSTFGYRYATLEGHLECGIEWFLLEKGHASGDIRFTVQSRWQAGQLDGLATRLGFRLLVRPYRALWLRRARQRLAAVAQQAERAAPRALAPDGAGAVQALVAPLGVEALAVPKGERAGPDGQTLALAAGLGGLTGMRSLSGIATLAACSLAAGARPGASRAERLLSSPGCCATLGFLAALELVADKSPQMPDRVAPPALAGRLAMGSLCGAAAAERARVQAAPPVLVGLGAAALSSVASYLLRKRMAERLRVRSAALGIAEDALVIGSAALLARGLGRRKTGEGMAGGMAKRFIP